MYLVRLTISDTTDEDGAVGEDEVREDELMTMVGWLMLLMMVIGSVMVMVE